MVNSIFDDPMAVQLANLAILKGTNPGEAFSNALTTSANIREKQRKEAEYQRAAQIRQQLPQLIQQIDISNPQQAFAKLAPVLGVETANQLIKTALDAKQEQRLQQGQALQNRIFDNAMGDQTGEESSAAPMSGGGIQNASDAQVQKLLLFPETAPYAKAELDRRKQVADSQKDTAKGNREFEYKVSGDFDTASKDFIKVRDGFANLRTAAQDSSPAGDIQLIFSFMKTQDPNSTVREGEFATAENTAGIPERVRQLYNKAKEGERLSPQQRQEFLRLGQKNYEVALKQHKKTVSEYRKRAQRFGLNPDNVITDYGIVEPLPTQSNPTKSNQMSISPEAAIAELKRRGKIR